MDRPADVPSAPVRGPGDPRRTSLVAAALGACLVVAIVKPWAAAGPRTAPPSSAPAAPSASSGISSPGRAPPLQAAELVAAGGPLPIGFRTSPPLPPSGRWTGLMWRRLGADDPLGLVTSVVRWRAGYVAVGLMPRVPATPVWTSIDGQQWQPLLFGTAATFWPAMAILEVADLPTGLVAVSEAAPHCDGSCSLTYVLPIVSWTSSDGRHWSPHLLPEEWFSSPSGVAPLVTSGPAGMLAASKGRSSQLALSANGVSWALLPPETLPADFALADLQGTAHGYIAAGAWSPTLGRRVIAAFSSPDGRHWTRAEIPLDGAPAAGDGGGSVSIVSGSDGAVVIQRDEAQDAVAVWQSPDGVRWRTLDSSSFPAAAPELPAAGAAGTARTFAGDAAHLIALGPGAAWVSRDGRTWRGLSTSGPPPVPAASLTAVLPDGLLATDGITRWFGQAVAGGP